MISNRSRYAATPTRMTTDSAGKVVRAIAPRLYYATAFQAQRYTLQQDERLDEIADRAYGDATLWWVIAVANPEVLYPDKLPAGTVLRIPHADAVR